MTAWKTSGTNDSSVQTDTVKTFPEQMIIVFFTSCFASIQCAILTLLFERDPNAWIVNPGIGMATVVFSDVSGSVIRHIILTWCLDKKGPLYVVPFKPLGIVIAAIMGIIFLNDSLHLGRTQAISVHNSIHFPFSMAIPVFFPVGQILHGGTLREALRSLSPTEILQIVKCISYQ